MWVRTYYMHQWLEQEHAQSMPGLVGPPCLSAASISTPGLSSWGPPHLHRLRHHLTLDCPWALWLPAIAKKKVWQDQNTVTEHGKWIG